MGRYAMFIEKMTQCYLKCPFSQNFISKFSTVPIKTSSDLFFEVRDKLFENLCGNAKDLV